MQHNQWDLAPPSLWHANSEIQKLYRLPSYTQYSFCHSYFDYWHFWWVMYTKYNPLIDNGESVTFKKSTHLIYIAELKESIYRDSQLLMQHTLLLLLLLLLLF
jgi:hypothetical protein